jgi:hypothetical protein
MTEFFTNTAVRSSNCVQLLLCTFDWAAVTGCWEADVFCNTLRHAQHLLLLRQYSPLCSLRFASGFKVDVGLNLRLGEKSNRIRKVWFPISLIPECAPSNFTCLVSFLVYWLHISSGQSSWLQMERSGFDSRRYQIFWEVVVWNGVHSASWVQLRSYLKEKIVAPV